MAVRGGPPSRSVLRGGAASPPGERLLGRTTPAPSARAAAHRAHGATRREKEGGAETGVRENGTGATAEGSARTPGPGATTGGARGTTYVKGAYLKDDAADAAKPEAVMYEPMADGTL